MFRNREDAARRLALLFLGRKFHNPLVLAIPRGGVVTGAVLAQELGAELDVVLARKLAPPWQPECAMGAVSEDGRIILAPHARESLGVSEGDLMTVWKREMAVIEQRKQRIRAVRPEVPVAGRSVIVTDDGVATGATMIAALQVVRAKGPREVIVAVPVGSPDRLDQVRQYCDELVCLIQSREFLAVGQFYADFSPVEDEQVLDLLAQAVPAA